MFFPSILAIFALFLIVWIILSTSPFASAHLGVTLRCLNPCVSANSENLVPLNGGPVIRFYFLRYTERREHSIQYTYCWFCCHCGNKFNHWVLSVLVPQYQNHIFIRQRSYEILVSYAACSRVRGFLPTYRLLTAATHSIPIVSTWPIRKRPDVGFPPNSVVTN
jgi:hypothetical protein